MSWNEILSVGMVGSGLIKTGAVMKNDGQRAVGTVGFDLRDKEFQSIVRCFVDQAEAFQHGLYCNGVKYVVLSANPRIIHARMGSVGVVIIRAKNCILVAQYQPPISAAQAVVCVENLADSINSGVYNTDLRSDQKI
jgi:profilin